MFGKLVKTILPQREYSGFNGVVHTEKMREQFFFSMHNFNSRKMNGMGSDSFGKLHSGSI